MNTILVVIDAEAMTYTRYVNRCRHVKVKSESTLTREEVEGFRVAPAAYVEGVPPEPVAA